ncbi:hypothetical protein ACTXJU_11850 [Glutamicibacter ardleyensis]|uniref:hypothetical protein n=1 Tax=Glutamicibacter ardleyensis TaxID=225894 RepID=UPI003FD1CBB1
MGGMMKTLLENPRTAASIHDYQSFSRALVPNDCIPVVREEFVRWLAEKDIAISEAPGCLEANGARATIETIKNGIQELLFCQLVEETPAGRFTTEIHASTDGWINISVRSAERRFVSVPRIAKALMRRLDLYDASLQLLDKPMVWDIDKIDDLIELLEDDDRHGLVFVAGSRKEEGELFNPFAEILSKWAREVYGLAQTIVLTPEATQELGHRIGHYAVGPWTLRTYFPGVDHRSSVDSVRHRYMGTDQLAQQKPAAVAKLLGNAARRHAATWTEPLELMFARRNFTRAATQRLIDAIEKPKSAGLSAESGEPSIVVKKPTEIAPQTVEPSTETEEATTAVPSVRELQSKLDLVQAVLGIQDLSEAAIREAAARITPDNGTLSDEAVETIESQLVEIEELQDELRDTTDSLNDIEFEQAEYQEELQKNQSEIRWLREKLREANDYESANGVTPEDEEWVRPGSCKEVLENIAPESTVVFTGDFAEVEYIDNRDQLGRAAFNLHHAFLALEKYARAKLDNEFAGDVEEYLRNHQNGGSSISAAKHAMNESKTTMGQWGKEREFEVPATVDSGCKAVMVAHFKLHRAGMSSARMHYLDDVVRSGKIYIGYVGPHLTNTQTN